MTADHKLPTLPPAPPDGIVDPPYRHPTTGWLSRINPRWHPYLQLMRLDRPYAALYFLIPQFVGCLEVAVLNGVPPTSLCQALALISLWTFFFRGATCAWNDTVDVRFDSQVKRTKHRPLARGAISVTSAVIFTLALTAGALSMLFWLPRAAAFHGILWIAGAAVYPLSKRFTWYPQLVCGTVLAWGVLFGASVLDVEALGLPLESWNSLVEYFKHFNIDNDLLRDLNLPLILLYLGNVAWTVCYETVYSYADVKDDKKAGVKNIALLMQKQAKVFLTLIAAIAVTLMAVNGYLMRASPVFFVGSVFGFAGALSWKLSSVNLQEPSSCLKWFMLGGMTAGVLMVAGLAGEYLTVTVLQRYNITLH